MPTKKRPKSKVKIESEGEVSTYTIKVTAKEKLIQPIPDDKFYKIFSFFLMALILGFAAWVYYNQNNTPEKPSQISIIYKDQEFPSQNECIEYCEDKYDGKIDGIDIVEELEGGKFKFMNVEKNYFFVVPVGVDVVEETELEGVTLDYQGVDCSLEVLVLHADATGLTLKNWLDLNYSEDGKELTSLQADGGKVYKLTSEGDTKGRYFFTMGENIFEVSYSYDLDGADPSGELEPACDLKKSEPLVEELIESFVILDDGEKE